MTLSKWNIWHILFNRFNCPESQRMKMFESPLIQMGGRESGSDEAGSKDPWPLHRWFRPLLTRGINLARQGWRQEGEKGLKEIIGRFGKGKKEEGEELGRGGCHQKTNGVSDRSLHWHIASGPGWLTTDINCALYTTSHCLLVDSVRRNALRGSMQSNKYAVRRLDVPRNGANMRSALSLLATWVPTIICFLLLNQFPFLHLSDL